MEEKSVDNKPGIPTNVFVLSIILAVVVVIGVIIVAIQEIRINNLYNDMSSLSDQIPILPPCEPGDVGVIDDCLATEGVGMSYNLGDQFKLSLEKKAGVIYSDPTYDKNIIELTKHVSSTTDGKEEWVFLTKAVGNTTLSVESNINGTIQKSAGMTIQVNKKQAGQPLLVPPMPLDSAK